MTTALAFTTADYSNYSAERIAFTRAVSRRTYNIIHTSIHVVHLLLLVVLRTRLPPFTPAAAVAAAAAAAARAALEYSDTSYIRPMLWQQSFCSRHCSPPNSQKRFRLTF